jgi:hypothetical protein
MKNNTLKELGLTFVEFKNKEEGERIKRGIDFKSVGYHNVPLYIIINEDGYIVKSNEVESWKDTFECEYTEEYIWKELPKLSKEEDKKSKTINKILKAYLGKDKAKELLLIV